MKRTKVVVLSFSDMLLHSPSFFLTCLLMFSSMFVALASAEELLPPPISPNSTSFDLSSAISRALNANRQLISQLDQVVKAKYGISLAESEFEILAIPNAKSGYVGGGRDGVGLSVGGGVDFSKKFITGTRFTFTPYILKTPDRYHTDLKAVISQPLLRGFGRAYQMSHLLGAQFAARSAVRGAYIAQQQLVTRTITGLYEIVKAEKTVELYKSSHQRIFNFYAAAQWKEKIGLAEALDLYRAKIELENADDQLNSATERLQAALDSLKDLLALPLDMELNVTVPLTLSKNNLTLEEATHIGLKHRLEIEQAREQKEDVLRQSFIAKKNLWPELNLVVDYANCGSDEIFTQTCWSQNRRSTWGLGLTTSTDFNATNQRIAYDQSLIAVHAAERGIDAVMSTVSLEVRRSFRTLERNHKKIETQEKQIHTALGGLKLAELKFKRGLANNFDVIQAEKSLIAAQVGYWSSLIDSIVGEYQFLGTLGVLCDQP